MILLDTNLPLSPRYCHTKTVNISFSSDQLCSAFSPCLSRSAMLEGNVAVGGVSVRPSVRLSHAGNASKLTTVGSRGFHFQVARGL